MSLVRCRGIAEVAGSSRVKPRLAELWSSHAWRPRGKRRNDTPRKISCRLEIRTCMGKIDPQRGLKLRDSVRWRTCSPIHDRPRQPASNSTQLPLDGPSLPKAAGIAENQLPP